MQVERQPDGVLLILYKLNYDSLLYGENCGILECGSLSSSDGQKTYGILKTYLKINIFARVDHIPHMSRIFTSQFVCQLEPPE